MHSMISILFAIFFVFWGMLLMLYEGYFSDKYQAYIHFGPYRHILGAVLLAIGIIVFYMVYRGRGAHHKNEVLICPTCRSPYNKTDVPRNLCPKCGVPLEMLKGFYGRHPDVK